MKKVEKKKIIIIAAIAFVVIAAVITAFAVDGANRVKTGAVTAKTTEKMSNSEELNAKLEPLMKYVQKSISDATVQSLAAKVGDKVEKGDIIAYLNSEYTDLYLSLLSQRDSAQTLVSSGNEEAEALLSSIDSQIEGLLSNEEASGSMFIYADVSGRICRIKIKDGDEIKTGDELFEIDDDRIYLVSFSVAAYNKPLTYGSTLPCYNADGKKLDFEVKIVKIENVGNEALYTLTVEGDPSKYYEDFGFVLLKLNFGSADGYTVPKEAIVYKDGKTYVYVIKSRKAHLTEVEIALTNENSVCISGGISEKDVVATSAEKLSDNAKVKIVSGGKNG